MIRCRAWSSPPTRGRQRCTNAPRSLRVVVEDAAIRADFDLLAFFAHLRAPESLSAAGGSGTSNSAKRILQPLQMRLLAADDVLVGVVEVVVAHDAGAGFVTLEDR